VQKKQRFYAIPNAMDQHRVRTNKDIYFYKFNVAYYYYYSNVRTT